MRISAALFSLLLLLPAASLAQGFTTYEFDGSFEDAEFNVENAIIDRGLVIDWTSNVGRMLARTGADLGDSKKIFENAKVFQFCSAVLSRKVMEEDPLNLAYCPYGFFIAEIADGSGKVIVGYRNQAGGIMQEVQQLLDGIAQEVIE